ncbi:MAG TPA: polyprenol monophosphomannose synthase [Candidatus Saccharimonadia bacterium]|nr:polyprenol monophosphomannose synthase [Candidatus Saccharimonadia bacterium]
MKIGIAIPTYNEAGNIEKLVTEIYRQLSKLSNLQVMVLVIDDDSPDGTADIVRKISKKISNKNFQVNVLQRTMKDGFGRAYIAGFHELLKSKPDYIIQMDADLSHNPVYLPAFVKAASKYDFIVGSRYVSGGETPDWTFSRKILSRAGNFYTRAILGSKISDYTGGFNMFSTPLMKRIDPDTIDSAGYGFLIDLKYRGIKNASSVHEIPIVFNDRQHGTSKMPKSTIVKNLILVPRIKFRKNAS